MDWRKAEIYEMFGHDSRLIQLLCVIKTEMFWLCKLSSINSLPLHQQIRPQLTLLLHHVDADQHQLLSEDSLLRILILDNENKLQESKKKEARKTGEIR
jgi:hypothetical protein